MRHFHSWSKSFFFSTSSSIFIPDTHRYGQLELSVVIIFLISVLTKMGIAIVTVCGGYAVITGRGMTVVSEWDMPLANTVPKLDFKTDFFTAIYAKGNFSTLVASVSGVVRLGSEMGSFFTNMYENHTMLKQISCIINDEDIGFDGGVDPFGSMATGIMNKEKHVVEKITHAMHRGHHHSGESVK